MIEQSDSLRCSQLQDDDEVATIEWLRSTKLDESGFGNERSFAICVNKVSVAVVVVRAIPGGWGIPVLFGNSVPPYAMVTDRPTRGRIRTLCDAVGSAY